MQDGLASNGKLPSTTAYLEGDNRCTSDEELLLHDAAGLEQRRHQAEVSAQVHHVACGAWTQMTTSGQGFNPCSVSAQSVLSQCSVSAQSVLNQCSMNVRRSPSVKNAEGSAQNRPLCLAAKSRMLCAQPAPYVSLADAMPPTRNCSLPS